MVTPGAFSATNANTWSNINLQTWTKNTTTNTISHTYSDTGTFTWTSVTLPSGLCRPQTSPWSPLDSVRNIVTFWMECMPAAVWSAVSLVSLSWLAPGGGWGIVILDLSNCIKAQLAYSPLHPLGHDNVGTCAVRQQMNDRDGESLMETLVW